MPKKIYQISVTLVIRSVSCPGVWLCPEGYVSLFATALGSTRHTARLEPRFPLNFNETFHFDKTFHQVDSLHGLRTALGSELIECELVQWPSNCCCERGKILATYCGDLHCVLYPPDVCTKATVELLMLPQDSFPGILSPMIKMSTITKIEEIYDRERQSAGGPLHICSAITSGRNLKKQIPVCHSGIYHINHCDRKQASPVSQLKNKSYTSSVPRERHFPSKGNEDPYHLRKCHSNKHMCVCHKSTECYICSEYRKTFQHCLPLHDSQDKCFRRKSCSFSGSCVDGDVYQNCKVNSARRLHNSVKTFLKNQ